MRYLTCGGEQLDQELVESVNKINSDTVFYNLYGPTEATILATYHECKISDEIIPIGKPIDSTNIHILNESLQSQPIGSLGEIFISGDGITEGYFNDELTKNSFKEDLFLDGGIFYKTGDMGKIDANGNLLYLGRIDNQVKINGRRIDLDEIKAKILESKIFAQAELLISDKKIIAFIVPKENVISPAAFKNSLVQSLPQYMVPKCFVEVSEIPFGKSGKVDFKKLESLFQDYKQKNENNHVITEPQNDLEYKIRSVWAKVLKVDDSDLCTNESFFELGGDSLNAVELSIELSKALDVKVDVAKIFQYSNISQQAKYLFAFSNSEQSSIQDGNNNLKIHRKPLKQKVRNKDLYQKRKLRRAL